MPTQRELTSPQEAGSLVRELAKGLREAVAFYEEHHKLSRGEAMRQALECPDDYRERVLNGPVEQLDWWGLSQVAETDPAAVTARWEEIRQAALDELQSGHRAALALE